MQQDMNINSLQNTDGAQNSPPPIQGPPDSQSDRKGVKPEKIDTASIDALSPDSSSGEYVRDSGSTPKKDSAAVKIDHSQDTKKDSDKKEFTIPILRTYQSDARDVAQTKGGTELRTVLAKEAEEKRNAQKEYLQKTRDIMKDSVVLQDRYENFSKKEQGQEEKHPIAEKADAADERHVSQSVSGALAYMKSVQTEADKGEGAALKQPEVGTETVPEVSIPTPNEAVSREGSLSDQARTTASSSPVGTADGSAPDKRGGLFGKMFGRARPEDVFTEDERRDLQGRQEKILEKESIESAWKDFQKRKRGCGKKVFRHGMCVHMTLLPICSRVLLPVNKIS